MNLMQRKTIMLIDDSSTNNFLHKSILIEEGYNVIICSEGVSALAKLHTCVPDLIVLDLLMPGMDGFRFLEKKKHIKEASHVPVIVLTSKLSSESEQLAHKLGAIEYLTKPVGISVFIDKIRMALVRYSTMNV